MYINGLIKNVGEISKWHKESLANMWKAQWPAHIQMRSKKTRESTNENITKQRFSHKETKSGACLGRAARVCWNKHEKKSSRHTYKQTTLTAICTYTHILFKKSTRVCFQDFLQSRHAVMSHTLLKPGQICKECISLQGQIQWKKNISWIYKNVKKVLM